MTDELLAGRFGVQRQQMNARVRRLAAEGLLQRSPAPTQPCVAMLTRKGARAVALPPRRAARTDAQRDHELALVWLVIELESAGGALVRTERECRTLEGMGAGRYSVAVIRPGRADERRWPDLVLETDGRRFAIELELTAKGTTRLQAIVDAYAVAPPFDQVVFLAAEATIAKRLVACVRNARQSLPLRGPAAAATPTIRVVPSPTVAPQIRRGIEDAVARSVAP